MRRSDAAPAVSPPAADVLTPAAARPPSSWRKVFWDKISKLVLAGHTADRACDLVYEAYGHSTSVTEIIRRMAADKKARLWPDCIAV